MSDDEVKENTRSLVHEAADRMLIEDGEIPTIRDILAEIGQGSHTTIAIALKDWKQQLGDRLRDAETIPELPSALARALVEAWHVEVENQTLRAQHAWMQDRRAADLRIEDLGLRLESALAAQETARRQVEVLAAEKESWIEQKRILDGYRALDVQVKTVQALFTLTEARYDEMEHRLEKENGRLANDRDQLQKNQRAALDGYHANLTASQDALSRDVGRIAALQDYEQKLEQRLAGPQFDLNVQREADAENRACAEEYTATGGAACGERK